MLRILIAGFSVISLLAYDATAGEAGAVRQGDRPLRINRYRPDAWGVRQVEISNRSDASVKVITGGYFGGRPLDYYSRAVEIPANASRYVRFPVRAAAAEDGMLRWHSVLQSLDGESSRLLKAADDYVIDSEILRAVNEPVTCVIGDLYTDSAEHIESLTELAAVLRIASRLTRTTVELDASEAPETVEGFGAVDYVVLGSNAIVNSDARMAALRKWLINGGRMWVRLDLVDVDVVRTLLGQQLQLSVVDRTSLNDVELFHLRSGGPVEESQTFEYPVPLVRMLVGNVEVIHTVNGWPASFAVRIGKGRVVFTTLGGRAWVRRRTPEDRPVEAEYNSNLIARPSMGQLIDNLMLQQPSRSLTREDFQPLLSSEAGVRIPPRNTILTILGCFSVVFAAVGVWLHRRSGRKDVGSFDAGIFRWSRRPELLAGMGPIFAVLFAIPIVFLGQASRRSAPASVSIAEFVEVDPERATVKSNGAIAVYSPEGSEASFDSVRGRVLSPAVDRLDGSLRQRIQSDFGRTYWNDLTIQPGLQYLATEQNRTLTEEVSAEITFGPAGVIGELHLQGLASPEDILIATGNSHTLAVQVAEDGRFFAGNDQTLPPGTAVSGTLLTDRQSLHQDVYQKLLVRTDGSLYPLQPALFAWTTPTEADFVIPDGFRKSHAALAAIPLSFQAPAPGTHVSIPSPFVVFEVVQTENGGLSSSYDNRSRKWRESRFGSVTRLRVQVPDVLQPLTLIRGQLELRIQAPARSVLLKSGRPGSLQPVAQLRDAVGTWSWALEEDSLQTSDGDLYLEVSVSDPERPETNTRRDTDKTWRIDFMRLSLEGQTGTPNSND